LDGLDCTPEERLVEGRNDCREDTVRTIIDRRQITPHFQPIVDLHHGTVLGWEVLSRGPASFPSAAEIFGEARTLGLLSRLESVCRNIALRTISRFPSSLRSRRFFINISPSAIGDPRLTNGHMQAKFRR
jgi:EAL domain-containing protein (putative c-di-GMP-specific phosphodiesterase class I)